MINKVKPVNNTLDYWHRYRPWAHKYLRQYTNDPDLHGNLDSDLWFLLKRILNNIKDYNTLNNYIKESIRGIAKRIKDKLGYKYTNKDKIMDYEEIARISCSKLNITLDEYLERNALLKYVDRLPDRQAIVIKKYFGISPFEQTTMIEIANEMKISAPRVYDIKQRGLKRLKDMMNFNNIYDVKDFIYGK